MVPTAAPMTKTCAIFAFPAHFDAPVPRYSSHARRGGESGLAVSENASITFEQRLLRRFRESRDPSPCRGNRPRSRRRCQIWIPAYDFSVSFGGGEAHPPSGHNLRREPPPPEVRSRARLTTTRAPWPPRKPPTTRRLPSCRRRTSMGNPSTSSSPRSWVRPSPNSQSDRATRTRPHRPDRVASRAPRQPRAEHSSRAAGGARLLRTSFDGERPLGRRPRFGLANFDSRVVRFRSKSASDRASLPRPPRVSSRKNPRREAHGCGESPGDVHHGEEDGVQGA